MDSHIQGPVSGSPATLGSIRSQRGFPLGDSDTANLTYLCTIEAGGINGPILVRLDGYVETVFNGVVNTLSFGTATNPSAYMATGVIAPATLGYQTGKAVLLRARTAIYAQLSSGTKATGTITSNNTAPADGSTVVIGSTTYTFKTTLTGVTGQVLINTTADAALLNLIRAINHSGTPGTDYVGTTANPQVSAATSVTSHSFAVTALLAGASGNSIATPTPSTSPATHMTWGAATLTTGADATTGAMTVLVDATGLGKGGSITI